MRGLGITAAILTVFSFILWLSSWSYWTFVSSAENYDRPLRYVAQAFSVLSVVIEMLAVLLIAIGLIVASKRLPKI